MLKSKYENGLKFRILNMDIKPYHDFKKKKLSLNMKNN